jgi:ABC-2 type transport system permease protein
MNADNQAAIEVRGLAKRFAGVQAVAGVDFDVRKGERFGFLGPNGAGKTTTINMLTGLARPDAGTIRIDGIDCSHNPKTAPRLMGVVPDDSNLYPELTGFGSTSLLAVTVTFEKKGRSFDRLLLAPIPLEVLMLAKTAGAILFGVANAFVPVLIAAFLTDLAGVNWGILIAAVVLTAVSSTFLGLLIAVSASEVFEAQTFSNFFRFPMLFLCGLFFPVERLPVLLRPLSYLLPPTYGVDLLRSSFRAPHVLPVSLDFLVLALFGAGLFWASLLIVRRKWIE